MKFCEWYFSRGSQSSQSLASQHLQAEARKQRLPPAPSKKALPPQVQQSLKKYQCPLCKRGELRNPCVLDQSGLAYCYQCVSDYINDNGCCPVTKVKATLTNIRKIYDS